MKPCAGRNLIPSQRIFYYRLSRARRTIENTFGKIASRVRVLRSPIQLDAAKTTTVTKASVVLRNMLIKCSENSCAPKRFADYKKDDEGLCFQTAYLSIK